MCALAFVVFVSGIIALSLQSWEESMRIYMLVPTRWTRTLEVRDLYRRRYGEELSLGSLHVTLDSLEKQGMIESEERASSNPENPLKEKWVRKCFSARKRKLSWLEERRLRAAFFTASFLSGFFAILAP